MATETEQVLDPAAASAAEAGESLNSLVPGADRLELLAGLYSEADEAADSEAITDEPEPIEVTAAPAAAIEADNQTTAAEPVAGQETTPGETQPPAEEEELGLPEEVGPELQQVISRRIGKEVAKRKGLEELLTATRQEITELKSDLEKAKTERQPAEPQEQPGGPLDKVQTEEDLRKVVDQAEQALAYTDELLDRIEDEPEAVIEHLRKVKVFEGQDEITVHQARAFLKTAKRNAERTLRGVPVAQKSIAERGAYTRQTEADFPWIKDQKSERYVTVQGILKNFPQLRRQPNGLLLAAIATEGLEAYTKRLQTRGKAGNGTVPAKPPPGQPGTPAAAAAAVRTAGARPNAQVEEARQAWLQDP